MSLATLVKASKFSISKDLLEHYEKFLPFKGADNRVLKELTSAGEVVDLVMLFSLKKAWQGRLPLIAVSPLGAADVRYYKPHSMSDRPQDAGFYVGTTRIFQATTGNRDAGFSATAATPLVPKALLTKKLMGERNRLFVLFETPVSTWRVTEHRPRPVVLKDADPFLLLRLNDSKFKIVGQWDVTQKELQLLAILRNNSRIDRN